MYTLLTNGLLSCNSHMKYESYDANGYNALVVCLQSDQAACNMVMLHMEALF